MQTLDINCDMGESTALWPYHLKNDVALLRYISSANIACGFHAGDAHTMHELVDAALLAGVAIGAHPGFADRENFGRTSMQLSRQHLYDLMIYQLGTLEGFLKINGARLHHVKPHGALYNMAANDDAMAAAVCHAIKDYDDRLVLYGLSGSRLLTTAATLGMKACSEVFADRTYQEDGSLTPRSQAGALIENEKQSIEQVITMALHGTVKTMNEKIIAVKADTLCIHSDGANALAFAKNIYQTLQTKGIEIKPV